MVGLPHRTAWHRLRALGLVLAAASVASRVQRGGYRYIHAHFAHHAELAMALSRLLDVPWGVTMHAVGIWRERNLIRQKVQMAELVMTCTDANRNELLRHAPERASKVHLVYHGLERSVFDGRSTNPSSCHEFVAVGRLVKKKGFKTLIRAWALLDAPRPKLKIIGDGPERTTLLELIFDLELSGDVVLEGALPNPAVLGAMVVARALIQPSIQTKAGDQDGIPNVIVEAMALGRPVIASSISGIPEVIYPGETGILVTPGSASELARAVAQLARDADGADRMGQAARAIVLERFAVERNVTRQLELVRQVFADLESA
jgi:glycosyltransferase involved in cell wall biosynthesis